MKKRLLSALLALALVFVLLPTTALADTTPVTDENVKINGTAVIVGNDISLGEGNGTYSYDKATHTLTLNSATINATGSNIGISFGVPVKGNINYRIELEGKNTITSTSAQAIYVEHDTSVEAWEKDTMKRSTLTINGSAGSSLNLSVSGSKEAIEAIWSKGDFTLSGGTAVTAFSSGTIAVNVGSMTINNSKLSAQSSSYGTTVVLYGFEMIGDAAEFEALNTSSSVRAVLRTSGASENIDWSNYQFTTGSYSGNALTKSEPTVCDKNTLNELFSSSSTTRYIHIAKRTIPALQRTSDVLIAKENAVVGVRTSLGEGNGYYTYNKDTKTLTLEDATISSGTNAIQFKAAGTYTVNLEGTNTISNVSRGILAKSANQNITGNINVILSGSGSLDISAKGRAIEVPSGNLTFNNTGAITLATTNTAVGDMNAIKVSGEISIGNDFNKNLKITTDNGDFMLGVSDLKSLNECKTITIAPKPSETYYNNTAMKYGETRDAGSGTISCDENGVITLNGATEGTLEFRSSADSTLVLKGANTLSSIVTTQKGLTISGSGSLTVGSIKVHNQKTSSDDKPNLTINGGAHVTVNRPSEDKPAVEVSGNLTVTGDGTQLSAECTAATNPAIEVGGNASFTGSTVTITNHSTTQGERYKDSNAASSALHVNGAVTISGGTVTAEAKAGGNAIRAVGNITVSNDATVTAKNNSQYFSAITAGSATGGEVNILHNLIVSGENTRITATNAHDNNLTYGGAINAYIKNANEGHYLKVGTDTKAIAPNAKTTVRNNSLTITRGDEVTRTKSPVVIAGTTLLNDTYYTITNGSKVAEGTDSNYNAFYDSATKTLKLNNASINGAGSNKAIEANVGGNTLTIELVGNNIIKTSGFANNVIDITGNLYFTGSGTAEVSGKGTPIYATYKIDVSADVTITNTEKAGSFTFSPYGENYKGANTFAIGAGYTAYATTDKTTWAVYDNTTASENESYTTLRITTQPPETGGGSTHQHVWDEAWHDTGDYHHAHQCTICKAYDTTTQELHNVTGHRDNLDGSHSNICGSCGYSAKVSHSYTWTPNANDNEKHIGTCVCGNVVEKYHNFVGDVCSDCGYDKSTGTTCEHVWTTEWTIDTVDNEYHWHKCIKCNAITDKKPHAYTIVTDSGTNHIRECECKVFYVEDHISSDWIIDTPATATTAGSMHKECTVCKHKMQTEVIPATGEIVPPTPDNPGTIVIIRPAEEEKPAQQPNPSTGANDLVGLAVAAAVAAALGSAALLRKHD